MVLVEGAGGIRYQDSVFVLLAESWDEARSKAMILGHSKEHMYRNSDGQLVRWAFERLITLDELGGIADESEVYSQPSELGKPTVAFGQEFHPEVIEPTQSV